MGTRSDRGLAALHTGRADAQPAVPELDAIQILPAEVRLPDRPAGAPLHADATLRVRATPRHAMPRHATPRHATPRHATLCHATPCHAVPRHAMPRRATPCHATPCHAMPHRATPRHAVPRHATPRHATPRHAVPRRATPCHAVPHAPHRHAQQTTRSKLHAAHHAQHTTRSAPHAAHHTQHATCCHATCCHATVQTPRAHADLPPAIPPPPQLRPTACATTCGVLSTPPPPPPSTHTPFRSPSESAAGYVYPRCIFVTVLDRRAGYYLSNVVLPLAAITGLTALSLGAVEPDGSRLGTGDRLSVSLTLMLTAVAYKFIVASSLPQVRTGHLCRRLVRRMRHRLCWCSRAAACGDRYAAACRVPPPTAPSPPPPSPPASPSHL